MARARRAAYRKAVVAAARRLKSDVVDRPTAMRRSYFGSFRRTPAPSGSTLRRSRLSRGQHVSNAACGAEQDERDDEAPCDLKGAASTR